MPYTVHDLICNTIEVNNREMKEKELYMNKVEVLLESLPYIKEYFNQVVVVKIGGSMMENDNIIQNVLNDLILMKYVGIKIILVHGGGKQINQLAEEKGIKPKFIDGLRVTDKNSIEIVRMVLVGSINTKIVSFLNKHGNIAMGISGNDSSFIKCHKKEYKKDGKIVINPFQVCLMKPTGWSESGLFLQLYGFRLNPPNKKKHVPDF